mgnify:CR=1 FL=1
MEQRIPQTVAMRRGAVEEEVIPSIARFSSLKKLHEECPARRSPRSNSMLSSGNLSSRIVLWYSVPVRASVLMSVRSGGRAGGSLLRLAGYLSGSSFVRCCRRQVTAGGASSSLHHGCGVWRRCRHNLLPVLQHPVYKFGRVLQVGIHYHAAVSGGVVEACKHGDFLAEVAREVHEIYPAVRLSELADNVECPVAAAVIDK